MGWLAWMDYGVFLWEWLQWCMVGQSSRAAHTVQQTVYDKDPHHYVSLCGMVS